MNNWVLSAAGLVLAACAFEASAQTCAAPLPLYAGVTTYYGDTCAAGNPLGIIGGLLSTQNDIVYSYVASGSETFSISALSGFAGSDALMALLPQCNTSADMLAFGASGIPMSTSGVTIPGHTYYVVVTGDPTGLSATACGSYRMTVH
jgi:hypothetical protein